MGSFRLLIKAEPGDSPEKVSTRNIREVRMSFKPSSRIKQALQQAKFIYAGENESQTGAGESSKKKKGGKEKGDKGKMAKS
jgi:hypothetical protein